MKRLTIPAALLLAAAFTLQAQTLRESIEVDGKYRPDIIVRERVFTLPEPLTFSLQQSPLQYDEKGVVANVAPQFQPLPVLAWRGSRDWDRSRGFASLDMGSWLQTDLHAGYRFIDDGRTTLGALLDFRSTSLFKPWPETLPDRHRHLYDGTLGVYGCHDLGAAGTLGASLRYRHAEFNYYGMMTDPAPDQCINAVDFKAALRSPYCSTTLWDASLGVEYFGNREVKETHLSLSGYAGARLAEVHQAGVGVDIDGVLYNAPAPEEGIRSNRNYANIALTPGYTFTGEGFMAHAGFVADITMHAFTPTGRYGAFHMAPDVRISYASGILGVYAQALGGTGLQTAAALQRLDYYCFPGVVYTAPMHSPVDAKAGVAIGPVSGISFGVHFAYKITDGRLLSGCYMSETGDTPATVHDLKGWSVGADAKAEIGKYATIAFEGSYQPQHDATGYFNGYDRPRWLIHSSLDVYPVKGLTAGLSLEHRGARWLQHLPDLTLLGLHASYSINSSIGVSAQLDNLLGRRYQLLPGQPMGALSFLAGIDVKF